MAKQFNVPPVVFPSGSVNPGGSGMTQRRPPTTPFQPPRPVNPGIPFMSFDIGAATASTSFSTPPIGSSSIGVSGLRIEDEPPLLEELGINPRQIRDKTLAMVNPFRVNSSLHEEADLSGPFLFVVLFGLFQLLAGKIHFGIILGWGFASALFLYVVFNMLAGRSGNLDLHRCLSLIGYCMLPIVMLSAFALFVPQGGVAMYVMAGVFVTWATRICTRLLVELAHCGDEHRGLIAYASVGRFWPCVVGEFSFMPSLYEVLCPGLLFLRLGSAKYCAFLRRDSSHWVQLGVVMWRVAMATVVIGDYFRCKGGASGSGNDVHVSWRVVGQVVCQLQCVGPLETVARAAMANSSEAAVSNVLVLSLGNQPSDNFVLGRRFGEQLTKAAIPLRQAISITLDLSDHRLLCLKGQ
ncbi:hypothetical protein RJ641_005282 [Dillenia turbinata]|uniref:Yip1 domain-containing protein n=1 Tax=Dillenia turbinata TaxID=194707 RepID=A0AAN8VGP7_9MAGN